MENIRSLIESNLSHTKIAERIDILSGGLGDKLDSEDVDEQELEKGIRIELEHTKSPELAKEIAMDHLAEDPRYYTKLSKAGL